MLADPAGSALSSHDTPLHQRTDSRVQGLRSGAAQIREHEREFERIRLYRMLIPWLVCAQTGLQ